MWCDSTLCGRVRISGCALIALRNDDMEWEPFDTSDTAAKMFPFNDENMMKHRVPRETLSVLAKNWSRMYAWFLEEPVKFAPEMPIDIKKGAQKIQSMDEDTWTVAWSKFNQDPDVSSSKTTREGCMTVLGMGIKDAFQLLEGSATMMLKGYKPDKLGEVYVSATNKGTAFLLGTFVLRKITSIKNMTALRKLEAEGYQYHPNQCSRQVKQLEKQEDGCKNVFAWIIEKQSILNPPLTWKTDSWHM